MTAKPLNSNPMFHHEGWAHHSATLLWRQACQAISLQCGGRDTEPPEDASHHPSGASNLEYKVMKGCCSRDELGTREDRSLHSTTHEHTHYALHKVKTLNKKLQQDKVTASHDTTPKTLHTVKTLGLRQQTEEEGWTQEMLITLKLLTSKEL